jgi:anti-anti-sigma factor
LDRTGDAVIAYELTDQRFLATAGELSTTSLAIGTAPAGASKSLRRAATVQPEPRPRSETSFAIRRQRLAEAVRVEVEGELDLATAPQLARALAGAAAEGVPLVVADLAGVTLFDSTTLLVLLKASLEFRARGGDLVVRPPEGPARRLFDLVGLDRPVTFVANGDSDAGGDRTREAQRLSSLVSSLLDENAQLQRALTARIVIEQAKGIVAERLDLDIDAAFGLLRKTARERRQRIHDLAHAVVEGSEDAEALVA